MRDPQPQNSESNHLARTSRRRSAGNRNRCLWLTPFIAPTLGLLLANLSTNAHADELLLRNLDRLENVTVASFDPNGVRLVGNRQLHWGQIQAAKVAVDRQAEFDQLLQSLGLPLYQMHLRLEIGDDQALLECTEPLLDLFADHPGPIAQWVWYANARGHLANHNRPRALESLLALHHIQRTAPNNNSPQRIGSLTLPQLLDDSGPTQLLPPIWFNSEQAQQSLNSLTNSIDTNQASPFQRLAIASLAVGAEEGAIAQQWLAGVQTNSPQQRAWRDLIRLQIDNLQETQGPALKTLSDQIPNLPPLLQACAWYETSRSQKISAQPERVDKAILDALRVPANADRYPDEVAAAALSFAAETLQQSGRETEAKRLRDDLLARFPRTWHAKNSQND